MIDSPVFWKRLSTATIARNAFFSRLVSSPPSLYLFIDLFLCLSIYPPLVIFLSLPTPPHPLSHAHFSLFRFEKADDVGGVFSPVPAGESLESGLSQAFPFRLDWRSIRDAAGEEGLGDRLKRCGFVFEVAVMSVLRLCSFCFSFFHSALVFCFFFIQIP